MAVIKRKKPSEVERLKEQAKRLRRTVREKTWANTKTNEGIKILYKELENKNTELKRLDQAKSQFVAMVSHEFKNPLSTIKETLIIISDGIAGEVNPKQKKMLDVAVRTVARLVRLVTDILDISKIEAGRMEMHYGDVDIRALIDEIVTGYEVKCASKHQELSREIPVDIGGVYADRDKLSEVIINVLNNAIKYTPEGGKVTISVKGSSSEVLFEIGDNGPGISKENLGKIFDKFERIGAEKEEGTGLGLPIAQEIVTLHKGKIWVESELGKGSRFKFIIPRDHRNKEIKAGANEYVVKTPDFSLLLDVIKKLT